MEKPDLRLRSASSSRLVQSLADLSTMAPTQTRSLEGDDGPPVIVTPGS